MLYLKLKNFTLEDAIRFEQQDRQFLALKKLYENKKFSDELYLFLIIINALISFQLSGKGEDYWEEFANEGMSEDFIRRLSDDKNGQYHQESSFNHLESSIYSFFENLLKNGKNNRRFVDMKLKRVRKFMLGLQDLTGFQDKYIGCHSCESRNLQYTVKSNKYKVKSTGNLELSTGNYYLEDPESSSGGQQLDNFKINFNPQNHQELLLNHLESYYQNMSLLAKNLAKIMNQKKDDKTIVFAVKMFSYGARNVFGYLEYFPFDLMIPIDSRLENLYKKYVKENFTKKEIKQYYLDLAKKLDIPPLHLDAVLWVNYEEILSGH